MVGQKSSEKARYWRAVLQRQRRSGLSIAAFCRSEGVAEASFYSWKRVLGGGTAKAKKPRQAATPKAAREASPARGFVPVQITREPDPAMIQVLWPSGLSVRIPAECARAEVEAVLRTVDGFAQQCSGG